jgi:pyridoxal phosphate enzyme (YggS family)
MIRQNLNVIKEQISNCCKIYGRNSNDINIIAVSKTIASEKIIEAISCGCKLFGENYLQEAQQKFIEIKKNYPDISLHLLGHLQSNKVKEALELFDCIHTLDSEKLALTIKKTSEKILEKNNSDPNQKSLKNLEIFIQVNIGDEPQKFGIAVNQTDEFIKFCQKDLMLNIVGLMAIPPANELPSPFFALLKKINDRNNFKKISMGMSGDFLEAIALGSSTIRIGSAIFGERK